MGINAVKITITAIDKFSNTINGMSKSLDKFANKTEKIGKAISLGLTVPIVAFGVASGKAAMEFESSMSRMAAFTGATSDEIIALNNTAKNLTGLGIGPKQAANGFKLMADAGFKAGEIVKGFPAIAALSRAAGVELSDSITTVDAIMDGYGKTIEDVSKISDQFIAVSKGGGVSINQLTKGLENLAPVAQSLGLGMEDLLKVTGTFAMRGIVHSKGIRALTTGLSSLKTPSKSAIEVFNKLGIQKGDIFDELTGNMKPVTNLLKLFAERGMTAKQAALVFGDANNVLGSLITDTSGSLDKLSKAMDGAAGATKGMNDAWAETSEGKLAIAKANFEKLQITIGTKFIPVLTDLLNLINKLFAPFEKLDPNLQNMILGFVAFVAVIGPLLIGLSMFITAITTIAPIILPVIAVIKTLWGILSLIAAFVGGTFLVTVGLFIAAFVAWGIAIYQLVKNWNTIIEVFSDMKLLVKTLQIMFSDLFTGMAKFVLPKWAEKLLGIGGNINFTDSSSGITPASAAVSQQGVTNTNNSSVIIDFKNAPIGMKATSNGSGALVDYTTGKIYAGVVP